MSKRDAILTRDEQLDTDDTDRCAACGSSRHGTDRCTEGRAVPLLDIPPDRAVAGRTT